MEDTTTQVFKQLLNPKFNWENLKEYDTLVSLAQDAVALKDLPQRIIGKIVLQINTHEYGMLDQFAKDTGLSTHSMQIYSWVERRLEGLEIPEDIPWSSLRKIAGTSDPQAWIDRVKKEGLSFAEVSRLIMIEKGEPTRHVHKKLKCPSCGYETEGIKCSGCGEVM
jgi:hypothetical protein